MELQSANSLSRLSVVEKFVNDTGVKNKTLTSDGFNRAAITYRATGEPPVTAYYGRTITLSPATKEIDLLGLEDSEGNAIAATGLRVQLLRIYNPSTHAVTVGPAAVNGYALFGSGKAVELPAGADLCFRANDTQPEIGTSARYLLLNGTLNDTVNLEILLG